MDFTVLAEVTGIGILSRNIVQKLKQKGWIKDQVEAVLAAWVVNAIIWFAVGIYMAWMADIAITSVLLKSLVGSIVSIIYHDFNSKFMPSPLIIQQVAPPQPEKATTAPAPETPPTTPIQPAQ